MKKIMEKFYLVFISFLLLFSCGTPKQTTEKNLPETAAIVSNTVTAAKTTPSQVKVIEEGTALPPTAEFIPTENSSALLSPSSPVEVIPEETVPPPNIEATSDSFEVQVAFKTTAEPTPVSTPEKTPEPTPEPTPTPPPAVARNAPYSFTYNGVSISLGANADEIAAKLGEPNSVFEAASCAVVGLDKNFYYNGVEIYAAYPDGAEGYISSIVITGSAKTPEGAGNGTSRSQIETIYGSDYADMGSAVSYSYGNSELQFIFEGDTVVQTAYYLQ